jgi:hypothetical protein
MRKSNTFIGFSGVIDCYLLDNEKKSDLDDEILV